MSDLITVTAADVSDQVTVTVNETTDAVTVSVTSVTDEVTVSVSNDTGPQGDAGADGADGIDYSPNTSWFGLVSGYTTTGAEVAITGGTVTPYNYNGGVTRYRYEASDESADAFYTTFDGTNLTGLVATKALSF